MKSAEAINKYNMFLSTKSSTLFALFKKVLKMAAFFEKMLN